MIDQNGIAYQFAIPFWEFCICGNQVSLAGTLYIAVITADRDWLDAKENLSHLAWDFVMGSYLYTVHPMNHNDVMT